MKFIGKFGFIALSLTLGACSAKQAPPPPPLTLVTKAVPSPQPEPAPLTALSYSHNSPKRFRRRSTNISRTARGRSIKRRAATFTPTMKDKSLRLTALRWKRSSSGYPAATFAA